MPSSTSNSDRTTLAQTDEAATKQSVQRATLTLILVMAGIMLSAELSARLLFPHISRIQQRIVQDQRQVLAFRTSSHAAEPFILLVGNSLLLRGLDYPAIQAEFPDAHVVRYVIENTNFLDWYYGLNHLFRLGVRPTKVVLCLNPGQTVTPQILGDYSARYLFDARDLLAVARDAGMDTTQTSSLFFAHWSSFYASRATIRNYLINVADPAYASALHELARIPQPLPPEPQMIVIARARLRAINELCRRNGSDFIFLVPPSLASTDRVLIKAADLENVKVTVPLPAGTVGTEYFRADGFHLNERGATLFTRKLAGELRLDMTSRQ
jgi:hypothetical protein